MPDLESMTVPISSPDRSRPRALAWWLLAVAGLVFVMVVIGGITRLTESGLSITEWKPVTGALPPMSEAAWQAEFDLYKRTTEYQTVNSGMDLAAFKFIYFWEWLHRLMGRLIGLAFFLPYLWFAARGRVPGGYHPRLIALLALGALQGAIGWWMVQSGLVGRTDVSHYRLAVHLVTALFILGGLVWTALDLWLLGDDRGARPARLTRASLIVFLLLLVQLLLGAWTAGLNAGYAFSSWPLMGGEIFPSNTPMLDPVWRNIVDNPVVVQFAHRWWAFVAVAGFVWIARRARNKGARTASIALHSAFGVQILLGIAVLLTGVELWLGVAHQAVGALVVAACVWCAHVDGRQGAAEA